LPEEKKLCGECGNPYEEDVEEDWFRCNGCRQWYHGECLGLDASAAEDQYFVFNSCTKCAGQVLAQIAEQNDENNSDDDENDSDDDDNDSDDDENDSDEETD
jgi:hypothetical protein